MSSPVGARLGDQVNAEFVEDDVEVGFSLVDAAEREYAQCNLPAACRILKNAEEVLREIERRLERADAGQRESFGPLVAELRREIDCAGIRYHQI
jgi:hypothetical protein